MPHVWGYGYYFHEEFFNSFRSHASTWRNKEYKKKHRGANPHSIHNQVRERALGFVNNFLKSARFTRYDIQKQPLGEVLGSSMFIDPIDANGNTDPRPDKPCLTFVDVDYYLDMSKYMTGLPILIYGFCPTSTTNPVEDSTHYYFNKDNEVVFHCNSGYEATHQLWDYGADYVTSHFHGSWFWFFWRFIDRHRGIWFTRHSFLNRVYTYRVSRLDMGYDRVITCLCPHTMHVDSWLNFPLWNWRPRAVLRRHQFLHESWVAFKFWTKTGLKVTIAAAGEASRGVVLANSSVQAACDLYRQAGGRLSVHNLTVATKLEEPWILSDFVVDYVKHGFTLDVVQRGWSPEDQLAAESPAVNSCSCDLHNDHAHSGEQKELPYTRSTKLEVLGKKTPPVTVVFPVPSTSRTPLRTPEDMIDAIKSRVLEPQKKAVAACKLKARDAKRLAHWFVKSVLHLVGQALDPISDEEVLERVPSKSRERISLGLKDICSFSNKFRIVKAFLKAEIYALIKAPRLITPLHNTVQAHGYRFTYALQDLLHQCNWFAFGVPPTVLTGRISEASQDAKRKGWVCLETDYSTFDGTITPMLRLIEKTIYHIVFKACPQLSFFLKYSQNVRYEGTKMTSGGARCSGAPDTCLMNSILNFIVMSQAVGMDHASKYGFFGGDDGILFLPEHKVERVVQEAARFGLVVKFQVRKPGTPFSFLARYMQWGSPNSMCDPDRLCPKMGLVCHNVPEKYRNSRMLMKIRSLLDSDGATPGVGPILRSMRDALLKQPDCEISVPAAFMPSSFEQERLSASWPNYEEPWMADLWTGSAFYSKK